MLYGNLPDLVIRSKSVIRSGSVTRARVSEISDQLRVSSYMGMSQNVVYTLGEGDFISFDGIPIIPKRRFQTLNDI